MALSPSLKIAIAATGLLVAAAAWNGLSQYLDGRHAEQVSRATALAAEAEAKNARTLAEQRQAQLAAQLVKQRAQLSMTHRETAEQSQQYLALLAAREEQQRLEALRVQSTYRLDRNQRCDAGVVINQSGSSFTAVIGKTGQPITCHGDTASEPLR